MEARHYGVLPRELVLEECGLDFLRGMIDGRHPGPPFSAATGIVLVEARSGAAVFEGTPSPAFLNPLGTIHGGWTAAIMDSALACAVHSTLDKGQVYSTVEFKVHLVRPVLATMARVRCEGIVMHRGKTLATSEARLVDASGKLLAHGTETCLISAAASGNPRAEAASPRPA